MEQFPANTTVEVLGGDGHTWMPATLVSPKAGSDDEGYVVQYTTTGAVEQGVSRYSKTFHTSILTYIQPNYSYPFGVSREID